jgi:Glucose/sorbosone dehydrogenases
MQGNRAGSLLDKKWMNASDDAGLRRVIRSGVRRSGMPGFSKTFTEPEIRALVILIRESAHRNADPAVQETYDLPDDVQHSERHPYRVEKVITDLDVPWALAFLPDGRLLVTERNGKLTEAKLRKGQWTQRTIAGTPRVLARDEGGLLSITPDPDYAANRWLYLTLSDPGPDETANTKLVRGRIRSGKWVDQQTIYEAPADTYTNLAINFGSSVVFHNGYLFFSFGERGEVGQAQNLAVPNGKVHRLFPDGRIPPDNPFVKTSGALASIWSYGHRNPQGLAIHPLTGELWETEHGPRGGDELNYIRRGRNYGWPIITHGMNYDGTPVSPRTKQAGMEQPVLQWTPSIAVSPIRFYTGDAFPHWKNQLFLGALAQQELHRLEVKGDRVIHRELILKGQGRVRDIITGPDGYLYLALEIPGPDTPDHVVRLVPTDVS